MTDLLAPAPEEERAVSAGRLPDFVIIGAGKAGTTSLFSYLRQHPAVFASSPKEPQFFLFGEPDGLTPGPDGVARPRAGLLNVVNARETVGSLDAYVRLFAAARKDQLAGEASPPYLYDPNAPRRMAARIPHARLLAILRDPVARAFSHYQRSFELGTESCVRFEEAVGLEDVAAPDYYSGSRHYLRMGFYHRQLVRFLAWFPRAQLYVCLQDDLRQDPGRVLREAFRFLGLHDDVRLDFTERHNTTAVPRLRHLHRFLSRPHPLKDAVKRVLPPALRAKGVKLAATVREANATGTAVLSERTRHELTALFEPDVRQLETLLDRDLSAWLT